MKIPCPIGTTFTFTKTHVLEMEKSFKYKPKNQKFGVCVEYSVRDHLLKTYSLTLFESTYPMDWEFESIGYDSKCQVDGATVTISARERELWDAKAKAGIEVMIWVSEKTGPNTAVMKYEIPYSKVMNKLFPSKYEGGTFYFYP